VFCGRAILACYLRRRSVLAAKNVPALMKRLRALATQATELGRACAAINRERLLKIRVPVVCNIRHICPMYAAHHQLRDLFALAASHLGTGP
jgi:hypothetical protein